MSEVKKYRKKPVVIEGASWASNDNAYWHDTNPYRNKP